MYGTDKTGDGLTAQFTDGEYPVAVYGLGKMGLPLAAVLADVTGNVVGVDIDPDVVETVRRGASPVTGEPGLDELVAGQVASDSLAVTTDGTGAAAGASVHVVIVPTLLTDDQEPDLATLLAAVDTIASGLTPGDLVVIESTVPPGTSRDVVRPRLAEKSGLNPDAFGVAFCPERTSSGRAIEDIRGAYPKVVGGVDGESERVAAALYDAVTSNDVIPAGSATTAECVKVFEGLYRDVNIALANELAQVAEPLDVDVLRAIEVANTQPFCDIHTPGPGVGGHCIPYYPYFLTTQVDRELSLVETAREVNDRMPAFVAQTIRSELNDGEDPPTNPTVLLLGATYRAGVAETRKAPARDIASELGDTGIEVHIVDPLLDREALAEFDAEPVSLAAVDSLDPDGVVLVTAHDAFEAIDWTQFDDAFVLDARQFIEDDTAPSYTVGRGYE